MLNVKIKTEDFIKLINDGILNIPQNEIDKMKSKIKLKPIKNGNIFYLEKDNFNQELKSIILKYSIHLELT